MAQRPAYRPFTDAVDDADVRASSDASEPRELLEDHTVLFLETLDSPALPLSSAPARPPRAETGLVPVVALRADGTAPDDRQDATRTTAETRAAAQHEPGEAQPDQPTALIIEDTPELADVLEMTLKRMSLRVVVAGRGNHAISQIDELLPDVVLLDLNLPDIPGWKVLEHLKERSKEDGRKAPAVVVITAYGDPANRLVGKLQGVHQYLVKPLKPDEVQQVVRSALSAVR